MLERERDLVMKALLVAFRAVAFLWLLHGLRLLLGMRPGSWGIVPRTWGGLHGILTAPLAHGDWGHLLNNSVPLFATIFLLVYFFPKIAIRASLLLYLFTGMAVWLLARGPGWGGDVAISHVGASGVAYALVSFLFFLGVFKRSMQSIIVALVILFYFSGMIAGVLPDQLHVSWESHLLGGIVGAITAYGFRAAEVSAREDPPAEQYEDSPYFPGDVFDYTRAERAELLRLRREEERRRMLGE